MILIKIIPDILSDLRKNKAYIMAGLSDVCTFAPSNDPEGDCGTTIAIQFDDMQKALTPGQSIVLYQDDIVLGGGIIKDVY